MARQHLIALASFVAFAALTAAGGAAHADDITIDNTPFMSTKSRTDVQAEVLKARAAGDVSITEIDLAPTMAAQPMSTQSRETVRSATARGAAMDRMNFVANYPA